MQLWQESRRSILWFHITIAAIVTIVILIRKKGKYGGCNNDMPDKNCPLCGQKLVKDGFDIPFETFLGFKGNKEPDIDLNFSGDYQSKAHKYTEVILERLTFRVEPLLHSGEKDIYGYVKNIMRSGRP